MPNKVWVGNIDHDVEKLLKARTIHESNENYPGDALYIYAENEPAGKTNEAVLRDLPGNIYTIEASDKISDNCKYLLITVQATQNQKPNQYGGFSKFALAENWCKNSVNS